MVRRPNKFATLLVLVLCVAAAVAQGPSDTANQPPGTVVTPAPGAVPTVTTVTPVPTTTQPGAVVPTTTPPGALPTPTTKKTPAGAAPSDASASGSGAAVPKTTTPAPSKTTKPPVVGAVAPAAVPVTPVPAITTTAPEILIDRTVKSEYGTRSPSASEAATKSESESKASKMGGWLVPAVIGAVIISALIIMTFFVRSHRSGHADEDFNTPRRGSENFLEHPKSTQHQVNVPVLGDPVKDKVAADQSSMRTVAVGGAHHSPRANRVASSPPLMMEVNRPTSPGFGTYKQKPMEGSSVVF